MISLLLLLPCTLFIKFKFFIGFHKCFTWTKLRIKCCLMMNFYSKSFLESRFSNVTKCMMNWSTMCYSVIFVIIINLLVKGSFNLNSHYLITKRFSILMMHQASSQALQVCISNIMPLFLSLLLLIKAVFSILSPKNSLFLWV